MAVSGYSFRPADFDPDTGDLPFLCELYASTRREEVAQAGWPVEQMEAFLTSQFQAQHHFYQEHFSSADFRIILSEEGEPIGRLYLDEWEKEFRIVDIALLPECRNHGIGSRILNEVINSASAKGKTVSIHVEQFNPAMNLYTRLGFEKIAEEGVYHLMRLTPQL